MDWSMAVFVLDRRKKPLMPCSEKRARIMLERGRAGGDLNIHTATGFILTKTALNKGDVGTVVERAAALSLTGMNAWVPRAIR